MENNTNNPSENDRPSGASEGASPIPSTVNIGGMTLKKRAPGSAPAPGGQAGGGGSSPYTRGPGGPTPGFRPGPGAGAGGFVRPTGPSPNAVKRMERFSRVVPTRDPGVRMNENIRVPEIRVIDDNGQVGVMSPREALEIARSRGLDLIEIVPNAQPPVCKIIDFGKWKYEQQKREKQAKKTQHQQLLKEVRFHPGTDTHDFEFKLRHARGFIEEGHKVKATVQFKGREVAYKQFGEELLTNFRSKLEDIAKVDQDISMVGRQMSMVLSPSGKKKIEAKAKMDELKGELKERKERPRKPAEAKPESAETDEIELVDDDTMDLTSDDASAMAEGSLPGIGNDGLSTTTDPDVTVE